MLDFKTQPTSLSVALHNPTRRQVFGEILVSGDAAFVQPRQK